jgi:hypothetical protein
VGTAGEEGEAKWHRVGGRLSPCTPARRRSSRRRSAQKMSCGLTHGSRVSRRTIVGVKSESSRLSLSLRFLVCDRSSVCAGRSVGMCPDTQILRVYVSTRIYLKRIVSS